MRPDATNFIARGMTLHNVSAATLALLLFWLGLGQRIESAQIQAKPLQLDYSAASRFGYVGASVTIPRPVDGQIFAVASGAARPFG